MNRRKTSTTTTKLNKTAILLKLSGAALHDGENGAIVSFKKLDTLAIQIAKISQRYRVGIVVGGGNIWRGEFGQSFKLEASQSDYVGMLATIINANLLKAVLNKRHLNVTVFSALSVAGAINEINRDTINEASQHSICVFAGGLGEPYFTTDTVSVLRALQMGARKLLIGKNGVNGVYSSDPKKGGQPVFFERLSYDYAVANSLKVMDKTAFSLASEHNLEMIVFNIDGEDSIINALNLRAAKASRTIISQKGE